jgi:GTP-binding protein Era
MISTDAPAATRAGIVAVVGPPNAGKSTLVNAMVGQKVSIVSPKVQTTRSRVLGIAMRDLPGGGRAQIVLADTPGIFSGTRRRLERAMVAAAWSGAADADIVLLVIDCTRGLDQEARTIAARLKEQRAPALLAINKVDLIKREKLLGLAAETNALLPFERTFMVSATRNDGIADVVDVLATMVPEGPFLYPEDQASDLPLRQLAAEIVREEVFLQLHDELPYQTTVETDAWEERKDGGVRIEQSVVVMRESQRKIVLGRDGVRIKTIGTRARRQLSEMLERPVHLFLHVKVRENWAEDRARYRTLGLDFDSEE